MLELGMMFLHSCFIPLEHRGSSQGCPSSMGTLRHLFLMSSTSWWLFPSWVPRICIPGVQGVGVDAGIGGNSPALVFIPLGSS